MATIVVLDMGDGDELPGTAAIVATDDQLATTVDDETVLLQTDTGTYYGFNDVGARVWEIVQDGATVIDVVETIVGEYDVERAECRRDVESILHEMETAELVRIDREPATAE